MAGIESRVDYGYFIIDGLTTPINASAADIEKVRPLHCQAEIVGYNTQILLNFMVMCTFIIMKVHLSGGDG
jgi:hypothetical protein